MQEETNTSEVTPFLAEADLGIFTPRAEALEAGFFLNHKDKSQG